MVLSPQLGLLSAIFNVIKTRLPTLPHLSTRRRIGYQQDIHRYTNGYRRLPMATNGTNRYRWENGFIENTGRKSFPVLSNVDIAAARLVDLISRG